MKKYLAAAAVLLLLAPSCAMAQDGFGYLPGFNLTLLGGWTSHPALAIAGGHSGMADGFNAGGRLEYDLGHGNDSLSNFALAADVFHSEADFAGAATGNRLNSTGMMADLLYYLPTHSPLKLYGGAGLGSVYDNLDGNLHGSSAVFGWQALGGIQYPLNGMASLVAEYRYQNAHDANIAGAPVGNTSNSLSVGVKFSL